MNGRIADHILHLESDIDAFSSTQSYAGNAVDLLIDGPQTFASMLAAIRSARHHVHFETFIYTDDEIGQQFAEVLIEKTRAGMQVRMICDTLGSRDTDDQFFEDLRSSGLDVIQFRNYDMAEGGDASKVLRRNHRKLLIVDGHTFFTGGINICAEYLHSSKRAKKHNIEPLSDGWRDTHIRVQGPAAKAAQRSFIKHWNDAPERTPTKFGPKYFPPLTAVGDHGVRVLAVEGDERDGCLIRDAYITALSAAKDTVFLTHGYFVPDDELITAMTDAEGRGVDVRILLPSVLDSMAVLYASRGLYARLLDAGVRIYETNNIMLHAKTAVIDDAWTTVGSCNLDFMSLYTNDEINVTVTGKRLAQEMQSQFTDDLSNANEIRLASWKRRPLWRKLLEFLALRLRPIM